MTLIISPAPVQTPPDVPVASEAGVVDIQHFAYPFSLVAGTGAAVVQQDDLAEVFACVQAIVACPIGFRDELPAFGVVTPEFAQAPIDPTALTLAVAQWEPRADLNSIEFADVTDDSFRHIRMEVSTAE